MHQTWQSAPYIELFSDYMINATCSLLLSGKAPLNCSLKSQSPFPRPIAHRAVSISVSIAPGHASANAVKATAGAGPLVAPQA